jgi:GT2 family glycosyltransferase
MQPKLSVIIPVRSEQLPSATVIALTQACKDFPLIEVIVVEGNALSKQRNEAVARASAPLIYFIDDDSCLDSASLKEAISYFDNPDIDVVGGPAVTRSDAAFLENCFGEVVSVPLGAWRMRARTTPVGPPRKVDGDELIFCNLMMRKNRFDEVAGMNEDRYPGEEIDLLDKLISRGAQIYYNPNMKIARPRRSTLVEFTSQFYIYGHGRGERIFKNFKSKDFVFLVPSLFAAYLITLCFFCNPITILPLLLYSFLCLVNGILIVARTGSALTGTVSAFLFLPLHLSYGVGMVAGMSRSLFLRMNRDISVRSVRIIELAYGKGLSLSDQRE